MKIRLLLAIIALAALSGLLSACGGSSDQTNIEGAKQEAEAGIERLETEVERGQEEGEANEADIKAALEEKYGLESGFGVGHFQLGSSECIVAQALSVDQIVLTAEPESAEAECLEAVKEAVAP